MGAKSAAEQQLEARAAQFTARIMEGIKKGLEKSGHEPLDTGQEFAVRRAVVEQQKGFVAVVKLEAATLFQAEVAKLKKELGQ